MPGDEDYVLLNLPEAKLPCICISKQNTDLAKSEIQAKTKPRTWLIIKTEG